MIEEKILKYLGAVLDVPCYVERPPDPPVEFITIQRTGMSGSRFSRQAMIAVRSYAATKAKAARLCEDIITAMQDFITVGNVTSCTLNSSYDNTNPTTKEYRYQSVFEVIYMED